MRRRSVLRLAGTIGVVGTSGCTQFPFRGQQYRLWFVRIHNGSGSEQQFELRVRRDGDAVFEGEYAIPGFRDDENEVASYAAMDAARLVEAEWDVQRGTYTVEYRFADEDSFEEVEVGEIDEFEAEDVGVEIQLYGGGLARRSVGLKVLEFDSDEQAGRFLSTVTNQTDG
ncbi:hypothetical protein [Halorussus halobius]|uniref:hypothetical protein n=1 Tax=Halorussus halobius TaxID=1710537 RepID=UPI001092C820|nr:hypothetical protein [Halorussus halobius]